ncbi:hypothetical protein B0H15DRAFT_839394 [Mycena belliarum]|uniref:Uncharacterized protein n=1 Tax=Mycena belliarum TaxID=1033014 RepID=A0AAD6U424_9AGAR|nr:hypothetical protein B0H15DRAFT_839394 [Mycena belliae]
MTRRARGSSTGHSGTLFCISLVSVPRLVGGRVHSARLNLYHIKSSTDQSCGSRFRLVQVTANVASRKDFELSLQSWWHVFKPR